MLYMFIYVIYNIYKIQSLQIKKWFSMGKKMGYSKSNIGIDRTGQKENMGVNSINTEHLIYARP